MTSPSYWNVFATASWQDSLLKAVNISSATSFTFEVAVNVMVRLFSLTEHVDGKLWSRMTQLTSILSPSLTISLMQSTTAAQNSSCSSRERILGSLTPYVCSKSTTSPPHPVISLVPPLNRSASEKILHPKLG